MGNSDDGNATSPIERAIALADREWRTMGIVAADRAALARDLRWELDGAAADDVTPRQLLGDDVRRFARDLALAAEVRRAPYEYRRLLLTALVGALPGLVLAWFLVWKWWLVPITIGGPDSAWNLVVRYALSAVVFVAGVLFWVGRQMRDSAATGRTVAGMAVLLPPAGILATPVTMGFASLTDYSTALPVLVVESAIVAAALAGATVLARRWALGPVLGTGEPPADGSAPQPPPSGPRTDPGTPRVAPG